MTLVESLKTQSATWFVGVVIALLTLFSTKLVEVIKFALNRAELRVKNYEEFSTDLSEFLFAAEVNTEFLEHNWTTRESLTSLIKEYNDSITKIRKKEYVYSSWIRKYWGRNESDVYRQMFESIRQYDKSLHSLNDEFEAVSIRKTQDKVSPERAAATAKELTAILHELRGRANDLLDRLQ